ncbi:MAG: response regulator [Candidatus Zixiibacteriota bacterium]
MKREIVILVVDDEPMMQTLLEKILTRDGYRVLVANDGAEALRTMSTTDVSIVISDLQMPSMSGMDLLKALKKDYPHLGIIMMTAYGDTYSVKDALLLGADEYITKPFKSFEISMVVERAYWRLLAKENRLATETD